MMPWACVSVLQSAQDWESDEPRQGKSPMADDDVARRRAATSAERVKGRAVRVMAEWASVEGM